MPSKIKDNFAHNVMTQVLGDEPNAFGNGYNCFERMLQCHCERDVQLAWIVGKEEYSKSILRKSNEFYYSDYHLKLDLLRDMVLYYEDRFVGDDDLEIIENILTWAVEHLEIYPRDIIVKEALVEAIDCLEKHNVIVDLEKGCIAKSMCEVVDSYYQTGFEGRCREQMPFVLRDYDEDDEYTWNLMNEIYDFYGGKNKYDSMMISGMRKFLEMYKRGFSECATILNDEEIIIDEYDPIVRFRGQRCTLNRLIKTFRVDRECFDVLRENGMSTQKAFSISYTMALLYRKAYERWVELLWVLVESDLKVLKLCKFSFDPYFDSNWEFLYDYEDRYIRSHPMDVIAAEAKRLGVSITWITSRLRKGMTLEHILKNEKPNRPKWEDWYVKPLNTLRSSLKIKRISDILVKEGLTKFEVEDEIGRWGFSRKDVLKAIRRIVKRRRSNGYGGG